MAEDTSVTDHVKQMKELAEKLAAIKAPISEEDQVVTLLGSLPSSYDHLVTVLEAKTDNLSLDFVQQSLLNEELKRGEKSAPSGTSTDQVLYSYHRKANKPGCFICGDISHQKWDCPKKHD